MAFLDFREPKFHSTHAYLDHLSPPSTIQLSLKAAPQGRASRLASRHASRPQRLNLKANHQCPSTTQARHVDPINFCTQKERDKQNQK